MLRHTLWALLCAGGTVCAAGNADIAGFVPDGMRIDTRIDADLTGEGLKDVVFVAVGDEARKLVVLARFQQVSGQGQGLEPIDSLDLETTPLGAMQLAVKKGVLIAEDLTGGTTATAATYRYRFDSDQDRMRLIGLDAERYSRTNSHGTVKLSWNLLNGAHIVQSGEPDESATGDGAYRYKPAVKTVQRSAPVYMTETPNPDGLIDAEVVPEGEDRE